MKAVTANRLTNGRVVYWTAGQGWSEQIADALALEDSEAEAALALALKTESTEVAGPYLIAFENGQPAGRERLKETIRLTGPTAGSTKVRATNAGAKAG